MQFCQSFQEIMGYVRCPRRNPNNPQQLREHDYLMVMKLAQNLILGQCLDNDGIPIDDRNATVTVSDVCNGIFEGDEVIHWAFHVIMEVLKTDGLPWGNQWALSVFNNGSLGSVSLWAHNPRCDHGLETCLINANIEIFFCKETSMAVVSYQAMWKCVSDIFLVLILALAISCFDLDLDLSLGLGLGVALFSLFV
jgi:hypothetical protein